jgi:hypothetical protein
VPVRRFVIIAAVTVLAACSDSTGPDLSALDRTDDSSV